MALPFNATIGVHHLKNILVQLSSNIIYNNIFPFKNNTLVSRSTQYPEKNIPMILSENK